MIADLRLAIPAAAAWVVVAVVIGMPEVAVPALVLLWAAAGLATVIALRWRALGIVALACAAAALCCTTLAIQVPARQPHGLDGAQVSVTAQATQTAYPGSRSFAATIVDIEGRTVAIPVLVFGESPENRMAIGSTLTLAGSLAATEPGDDVAFLLFPDAAPVVTAPPPWYLGWADALRVNFAAASARLPGDGGDLLAGLAIGDTSAVSDELDAAMKVTSLSHLTAVSGANCAIVIGLIMAAGAAIGMPRAARIAASTAVLVAFVTLVTPEPSVLRAALMATLVLVALWRGRPVRGVPVLALATLTLLVMDPWLARNYGFVLSVLATGGLLMLAGPLARRLERWLPRWLAVVIAVPLAAQLACQPVIILLNASLPTYGVVANLLSGPLAPVATVVGLAACVLLVLVPPLGQLLCQLAWLPSAGIAGVAQFFAALPFAQLPWVPGWWGVVALTAVSALLVLSLHRRWAVGAVVVVLVAYGGLVGGARIAVELTRPAHWQVAMCDVGQGDAAVVRSGGVIALIDTGPEPARLTACLTQLGIDRIDLLVLTHFDLDHVGGAPAVIGRVDRAFVGPSGGADNDRLVADLVAGGAQVEQVSRGPTGLLGELRWQVLWPPVRMAGIEPGNPASVTVAFEPVGECADGCLSSIFLGDLGEEVQDRLLDSGPLPRVDVVKVAHHGSSDQSEALYSRLGAVVGLIGVGADNGYGHPTDRLLDILARSGIAPLRTDQDGLILLAPGTTAGTVTVWTSR